MKKSKFREIFTIPMIVTLAILIAIILMSLLAPVLTKYDPDAVDLMNIHLRPSAAHLLGTDDLGRDQFTRLLYGGRTSLLNALLVMLLAMVVGIPMGLLCGFYGGWIDTLWMRICDLILAFPGLLLAFILVIILGRGGYVAVVAIAIMYIPGTSKLARSLILTEKTKGYVETCRSVCFSDRRIIFRHILPNCIPTMVAELALDFGYAITTLTSLSFLGLGVQAPKADWGCMLSDALSSIFSYPNLILGPAVVIVLITVSLNILSDGILRYLDPDQRKVPSIKKYLKRLRSE
ncbi:MAG: ABC transporter permease [Clostridiales bacterium]|nr:ABC transporter permease [Clostridiales bacterium]